jgi:hypothetical protein
MTISFSPGPRISGLRSFSHAFLVACGLAAVTATAGVVTPISDAASSYYSSMQVPVNLINGSGLWGSTDVLSQTHSNDASAAAMWHSSGGAVNATWVSFDLGSAYTLTGAYVWQMNQTNLLGRGVKTFGLFTSPNTTDPMTNYVGTFSLNIGSGTRYEPHQTLTFPAVTAQRVLFAISNDWNGLANDYVGLSEVRFEGTTPPPVVLSVTNALAGYWNFDETSGSVAADASGNANSGLVQNAFGDGGQWTAGKVGGALRFRGPGFGADYVTVPSWSGILTGAFSMSAWIQTDSNPNGSLLGAIENSAQAFNFAQENALLPAAAWQHVAMAADGKNLTVYRNGYPVGAGSCDGTFYNPANVLTIGALMTNGLSPDALWQGKIDEYACWTRGLSADDVFKLFAAGVNNQSLLLADSYSNAPPLFASPLQGGAFFAYNGLSLQADAAGFGTLTYQWWKDGVLLANATNRTFTTPSAGFSAAGQYAVVVTDRNGHSITSAPVVVTITAPALSLTPASGGLSLAWPAGAGSYSLQSAPALGGPWTLVPGLVTNSVLLSPTNAAQFYRLYHF